MTTKTKVALGIGLAVLLVFGGVENSRYNNLRKRTDDTEGQIEKLKKDATDLKTENEKLRGELAEAKEDWNKLASYNAETRAAIENLAKELAKVTFDLGRLKDAPTVVKIYENADYLVHLEILCKAKDRYGRERDATILASGLVVVIDEAFIESVLQTLPASFGEPEREKMRADLTQYLGKPFILSAGHIRSGVEVKNIYVYMNNRLAPEAGEIVGYDEQHDVAVLKFSDSNFVFKGKAAKLGCSGNVKAGELVLSLGSPLGIRFSTSVGLVMNVRIGSKDGFSQPQLIMHSALINPGNSGGPLTMMNENEEVVGINVMGISGGSGTSPMYLAVPIDDVKVEMVKLLTANGGVKHGLMEGVAFRNSWEMNNRDIAKLGLSGRPANEGVMVTQVATGSKAEAAGLKVGDMVVKINGILPNYYNDVVRALTYCEPESNVTLEVVRGEEVLTLTVQLGLMTETAKKNPSMPAENIYQPVFDDEETK